MADYGEDINIIRLPSAKNVNAEIDKLRAARYAALHLDDSSSTIPATMSLVRQQAGPTPPEVVSRKRKRRQDQEDIGYNKITRKESMSEGVRT